MNPLDIKPRPAKTAKTLRDIRGYGLGERDPRTQQYGAKGYESQAQDEERTAHWNRVRREVETGHGDRKYWH